MPTHNIPHVWTIKRCKSNKIKCVVCNLSMSFLSAFEKCQSRNCKYVGWIFILSQFPYFSACVHTECKPHVQDNCGLTPRHVKEIITHMIITARQVLIIDSRSPYVHSRTTGRQASERRGRWLKFKCRLFNTQIHHKRRPSLKAPRRRTAQPRLHQVCAMAGYLSTNILSSWNCCEPFADHISSSATTPGFHHFW